MIKRSKLSLYKKLTNNSENQLNDNNNSQSLNSKI